MTFTRGFEVILNKENNNISKISLDKGITVYNFNRNYKLISKKQILEGKYTILDIGFDISDKDIIYGIINNKQGELIYVYITDKIIVKSCFIKYNKGLYTVKLPYIKKIYDSTNILYYLLDNREEYSASLISYYKKDGQWIKYEVDKIGYQILTDFNIVYKEKDLYVFYYNLVSGCTELFVCKFNFESEIWTKPIQITNDGKMKVYLSVIKGANNNFDIVYSENNMSKFNCKYLKVGIESDGDVIIYNDLIVSKTVACTFPSIVNYNDNLYIHWSEYSNLYSCASSNKGDVWGEVNVVREFINHNFSRCSYKSNNLKNEINTLFIKENSLESLSSIKD